MANIHLTSTIQVNLNTEVEISKSSVLKLAWFFVKTEGVNISYAMTRAWKEAKGELERNFWTDALKIRKWDSIENQHPLDWVAYQLRRQGFKISKVKPDTIIKRKINTLNIDTLRTPNGFSRIKNTFCLTNTGISYCMKNGFIPS